MGTRGVAALGAGEITNLSTIGSRVFFTFDDGTHGQELWTSDGTSLGTFMVKDIDPGSIGSSPEELTSFRGALYLDANDGAHGPELWKSDGTATGTVMVKDINPSSGSVPSQLTDVNGTLYFEAQDGVHGFELWKSDATRGRNSYGQGYRSWLY